MARAVVRAQGRLTRGSPIRRLTRAAREPVPNVHEARATAGAGARCPEASGALACKAAPSGQAAAAADRAIARAVGGTTAGRFGLGRERIARALPVGAVDAGPPRPALARAI